MKDVTNGKKLSDMLAEQAGVYALHLGEEIIYVGQAMCIRSRIGGHMAEKTKFFDGYSFACLNDILAKLNFFDGVKYLDWVEAWEINRVSPPENRRIPRMEIMESAMRSPLLAFARKIAEGVPPTDADFSALANRE